jgi:L-alanine-DL-glutamate epimerase-like enolase superfamily enzyme
VADSTGQSAAAHAIATAEVFLLAAPINEPVETAFGRMDERPALLLRLRDRDGAEGWGEVWCNFPACGAAHRAALVRSLVAPLVTGQDPGDPAALSAALAARLRILAIQSGESGPFAQVLAGLDCALWDLAARRAGLPLRVLLAGAAAPAHVPVYASGINPGGAVETVARERDNGHRAFKLKIGFGQDRDRTNLAGARAHVPDAALMADANQAWAAETAIAQASGLTDLDLHWLEEPVAADQPPVIWQRLRRAIPIPLAAGENLRGEAAFAAAIRAGNLAVIQPDCAKWGGVTGCLAVGRAALAAGRRVCPHYLGAGIGLLHSAHILAAAGGDGLLEVDINPNPLRSLLAPGLDHPRDGIADLPDGPGIGVTPAPALLAAFRKAGH